MRLPLAAVLLALALALVSASTVAADDAAATAGAPDYATRVAPILKTYCVGCHNDGDREGEFSLESYQSLRKGTPHGPAVVAGKAANSRIIRQLTGAAKPSMPPKGEPKPSAAEVEVLRAWVDAGAVGPLGAPADRLALVVPQIESRSTTRPITALDASRDGKWIAVARFGTVALHAGTPEGPLPTDEPRRVLTDFPGKVTAVHFTADGARLVTASGVAGLGGVAALWNVEDGSLIRQFKGQRDLLYDAELSPDGKTLATCGYDKMIQLWDVESGTPLRTLSGHNGAVYDVAFSPDGRALVSASADDTCKVWRVADGVRLDTLPQPLKEEYCCAFSPDGRFIVAGGADNTIRVWEFASRDEPKINPMIRARFAHEGPITRLAFTPDGSKLISLAEDRAIKVWETTGYTELRLWERQPDVATALALSSDGGSFCVGRMDGSFARYSLAAPPARDGGAASAEGARTNDLPMADRGAPTRAAEREPNDVAAQTQAAEVSLPAEITGAIAKEGDVDLHRFSAKAGEQWVIEVNAARSKSKLDSFVEVLDSHGDRIPRVLLHAVRSSYFTFRGKDDSITDDFRLFNWEEMKLNEYLYANGEVVKLWLSPRGPDSGFQVYPGDGKRWGYFDTTPLTHALGEPCYIVEPHPPGTEPIPNGLPVFPLYFDNDDDSQRALGDDSRLFFTAPADGTYLAKIKDVRGLGGPDFPYTMTIRPRQPDFQVTLQMAPGEIGPGDAREFKLVARRLDGFEGPIRVDLDGVPAGFTATTPVVIEAGQTSALGVIAADETERNAGASMAAASKLTASAPIWGRAVSHPVNLPGELKKGAKPKLRVRIAPDERGTRPLREAPGGGGGGGPLEFEIRRGETITLKVKAERDGFAGPVPFGNAGSGRNLPFGVIVDNLGLNGLLILDDQAERTFFITADPAATPQTRLFHLNTAADGGHSSLPVVLHLR